jgi:Mlc titration factor MtfA (ptsG expression regulator)
LLPFLFFTGLALAVAGWLAGPPLWRHWRRERIRRQPFPRAWRAILQREMPLFRRLPAALQLQLKKHVQVLLAEKAFIGCGGLVVTERMRVLVAAQAGLLLLNRRNDFFPRLRQVLLYPAPFVKDRVQADGSVVHESRQALAGESGRNVVIHEFAHQLDQDSGTANGAPWIPGQAAGRQRWAAVFNAEYRALHQRLQRGEEGLIDPYGATDPAEFFAVTSELFFERPRELAAAHPALYRELAGCYRCDPAGW